MPSSTIFLPMDKYPYVSQTERVEITRKDMKILEISTRSQDPFGKSLSPFNLRITLKSGKQMKVECAYQGSKVVETKGKRVQYPEFYWGSPRDAAIDPRIKGVRPVAFSFLGKEYPINPKHCFFDFLYIVGLYQRKDDVFSKLSEFDGYSDMFYSPRKDQNCQSRAAARFVSLRRNGIINENTPSVEILKVLTGDK